MLKTEDMKSTVNDAKKMKTVSCAGSPIYWMVKNANKSLVKSPASNPNYITYCFSLLYIFMVRMDSRVLALYGQISL